MTTKQEIETTKQEMERKLDIMRDVIEALEEAFGIAFLGHDETKFTISYNFQNGNCAKLQELYKNDEARRLIDKFLEVGKIDHAKFGFNK